MYSERNYKPLKLQKISGGNTANRNATTTTADFNPNRI